MGRGDIFGFNTTFEVTSDGQRFAVQMRDETGEQAAPTHVTFLHNFFDDRLVMIRRGRFKMSLFLDPQDPRRFESNPEGSLYDLENDPGESRNLFRSSEYRDTIHSLRTEIETWDEARLREKGF